ncbi:hypothetical protein HDU96_002800 [Phlyctochytrium bullatum]|nr:hypothetical protein HDU96_002800 [Phlyctochytrium bullatum]
MTRFFKEPQYHIFLDVGATSTFATLAKIDTVEIKDKSKRKSSVVEVELKAVSSRRDLGGLSIDILLQEYLATTFQEVHGKKATQPIKSSPRGMIRLLKEANRVKHILSANSETMASVSQVDVEGVHEDIDFRTKVTRKQLEDMISDLLPAFVEPVHNVLEKSALAIHNISSVILVGGSVRIPAIQAQLKELVGEDKIAVNINQDEAITLGAGFRAAGVSNQFKVREIRVKDIVDRSVEVWYETESGKRDKRTLKTLLFSEGSFLGSKKLMNFNRITDFTFELHEGSETSGFASVSLTGLSEAVQRMKASAVGEPKVKALIELSDSGVVSVLEAFAQFEVEATPSIKAPKANSTDSNGKKIVTETVKLNFTVDYSKCPPLSTERKTTALKRLQKMDLEDSLRRIREEARNNLESFIYNLFDLLENEEALQFGTKSEWDVIRDESNRIHEWLQEEAEVAETSELRNKMQSIQTLYQPIQNRRTESRKRPEAIAQLKTALNATSNLIAVYTNMTEGESGSSLLGELEPSRKIMEEVQEWLAEKEEAQAKLDLFVNPVLETRDVEAKKALIDKEFTKLISKQQKFIRASRKATETSSSSSSGVTSSATATESKTDTTATPEMTAAASAEDAKGEEDDGDDKKSTAPEHSEL